MDNAKTIGTPNVWATSVVSFSDCKPCVPLVLRLFPTTPMLIFLQIFFMIQMIIGGPGGTAGGIKVTTASIMFLLFQVGALW